jgi:hypothetical protein
MSAWFTRRLWEILATFLGVAIAFPGSVMIYFEWEAKSPEDIAWGFRLLLLLGGLGGMLWQVARYLRPRRATRIVSGGLLMASYAWFLFLFLSMLFGFEMSS